MACCGRNQRLVSPAGWINRPDQPARREHGQGIRRLPQPATLQATCQRFQRYRPTDIRYGTRSDHPPGQQRVRHRDTGLSDDHGLGPYHRIRHPQRIQLRARLGKPTLTLDTDSPLRAAKPPIFIFLDNQRVLIAVFDVGLTIMLA